MAYNYSVMIVLDIEFDGGSARGTGSGKLSQKTGFIGGAGYEVQVISISCKAPCSKSTLCKRALTIARQNALNASIKYNWGNQGLRVTTVSCTVI